MHRAAQGSLSASVPDYAGALRVWAGFPPGDCTGNTGPVARMVKAVALAMVAVGIFLAVFWPDTADREESEECFGSY